MVACWYWVHHRLLLVLVGGVTHPLPGKWEKLAQFSQENLHHTHSSAELHYVLECSMAGMACLHLLFCHCCSKQLSPDVSHRVPSTGRWEVFWCGNRSTLLFRPEGQQLFCRVANLLCSCAFGGCPAFKHCLLDCPVSFQQVIFLWPASAHCCLL